MLEQRSGVIINTSSQLAFHGAAEGQFMLLLKQVFPNLQNQLRQNGLLKELELRVLLLEDAHSIE